MRLNYRNVLADALNALLELERLANSNPDNPQLLNLGKIPASQLDGRAHCVGLQTARRGTRLAFVVSDAIGRHVVDVRTCPRAVSPSTSVGFAEGRDARARSSESRSQALGSTVLNAICELSPVHA